MKPFLNRKSYKCEEFEDVIYTDKFYKGQEIRIYKLDNAASKEIRREFDSQVLCHMVNLISDKESTHGEDLPKFTYERTS